MIVYVVMSVFVNHHPGSYYHHDIEQIQGIFSDDAVARQYCEALQILSKSGIEDTDCSYYVYPMEVDTTQRAIGDLELPIMPKPAGESGLEVMQGSFPAAIDCSAQVHVPV